MHTTPTPNKNQKQNTTHTQSPGKEYQYTTPTQRQVQANYPKPTKLNQILKAISKDHKPFKSSIKVKPNKTQSQNL